MKNSKIVILYVALLSIFTMQAQTFQGKAFYKTNRVIKLKTDSTQVNSEMQKQLQAMLKKQYEKTYILDFNKKESTYKEEISLDKPQANQGGIIINTGSSTDVLHKNIKTQTYTKAKEFFGKKFLIQDSISSLKWVIQKDTKMIGKYLCIKATTTRMITDFKGNPKELSVLAWYTPEIPIMNGPELYGGLPGLILELHEDKMNFVCNKIILNSKDKTIITIPTKGKKVSQAEYDTTVSKKIKEMRGQFQGGKQKKGKSVIIKVEG